MWPRLSRRHSSGARYLIRFDDLCPTMDRAQWARFVPLLSRYAIRPILAVVPDNQDPALKKDDPDPSFWTEMRQLQASGATIGLHGFQHVCTSTGKSLIPLHRETEFAGLPEDCQRYKIRRALAILRGHALDPSIWVAPRHGFDITTLKVLREESISLLSDGLGTRIISRYGLTWIPQQLWAPVNKNSGLWTIAYHPNTTSDAQFAQLESFLAECHSQFTCVQNVVEERLQPACRAADWLQHQRTLLRMRLSRLRRKLIG